MSRRNSIIGKLSRTKSMSKRKKRFLQISKAKRQVQTSLIAKLEIAQLIWKLRSKGRFPTKNESEIWLRRRNRKRLQNLRNMRLN